MFFKKAKKQAETSQTVPDKPHVDLGEGFYYTYDEVSNGVGGYCKANIWLHNKKEPGFARCIIDKDGHIQNFPGFEEGDWVKDAEYPLKNRVRFPFSIDSFIDGKAAVHWMFQPDGWYYADSQGFGAEKDEEINLHSYIDKKGNFLLPFYHYSSHE